jgi:hypothetical protein
MKTLRSDQLDHVSGGAWVWRPIPGGGPRDGEWIQTIDPLSEKKELPVRGPHR